jgi:multidrug efflux pump subunit AcrB
MGAMTTGFHNLLKPDTCEEGAAHPHYSTVSLTREAPLGQLVNQAETQILAPLRAQLPPEFRVELAGSADRFSETIGQLASAFIFSVIITSSIDGAVTGF